MNLGRARVVLRTRSVLEVLDLTLRVWTAWGPIYRRVALVALGVPLAIVLALKYAAGWTWWSLWPTAYALAAVAQGAFTVAAGTLMFEGDVRARTVLARFARKLPRYLWSLLLTRGLAFGALTGLLLAKGESAIGWMIVLIGGPIMLVQWAFVHETVLLEGVTPVKRASRLIRRYAGAALGLQSSVMIAQLAMVFGTELMGQAIVSFVLQLGQPLGALWEDGGSVFALVGLFGAVPFVATARFLEYLDLRTRKEGWDLQLKFAAVQARDERRAAA